MTIGRAAYFNPTVLNNSHTGIGTLNANGGTIAIGTLKLADAGGYNAGGGTSKGQSATGTLNVAGGAVSVTGGGITLGTANLSVGTGGGGLATAAISLTGGSLTVSGDIAEGNVGASSSVTLNGGTLNMSGNNIVVDSLSLQSGTLKNLNQYTVSAGGLVGAISKTTGGTLVLDGTNSYTGATSITGGVFSVATTGTVNSTSGITINGTGAELNYNSSTDLSPAITFTKGTISGNGTGRLTAVSAGANDFVAPGATSAAASFGTLKTGNFTLGAGSTYKVDVNLASTPSPIGNVTPVNIYQSDTVDVQGSVALGGALVLNVTSGVESGISKTILLINNDTESDAIGGTTTFSSITPANGGMVNWFVYYNFNATTGAFTGGNDVAITFTAIPEPTGLGLIGLASAALLGRRRRKVS